jgi:hypothetical protein
MPKHEKNDKSTAIIAIVVVLFLVFAGLFFGRKLWQGDISEELITRSEGEKPAAEAPQKIPIKIQQPIDYEKNPDLMTQRKAELGLGKGVDMIVKPGETIRVGDTLVSMDEILDKIRLKTGAIEEKSISDQSGTASAPRQIDLPTAIDRLRALEKEYAQLKAGVDSISDPTDTAPRRHLEKITEQVRMYRQYKDVLQKLADAEKMLAGANQDSTVATTRQIEKLTQEKAELETAILAAAQADRNLNAYGIYIVRPGNNIWNIHFQFLRDYFIHKGVSLSPAADEPGLGGQSSGVGRLLKFSENMVHIYNLREKKIDPDLNLIHPLSKIVVFNLARVFAMLESINFNEVDRIRFDGETLWLPAKNN